MTIRFEISSRILQQSKQSILKDCYHETLNRLWYLNKNTFQRQGVVTQCIELTVETLQKFLAQETITSVTTLQEPEKESDKQEILKPVSQFSMIDDVAKAWAACELGWADIQILLEILEAGIQRKIISKRGEEGSVGAIEGAFLRLNKLIATDKIKALEQSLSSVRDESLMVQTMSGRFLANSSHDMKTPLTAILGFSDLLMEEFYGPLTDQQKMALEHIENSAQNLLEIVNNFLDLMHIRAGKLKLTPRPVDITKILTNLHLVLSPLSLRRKVKFLIEIPDNLGVIEADEGIVRHIVYYLLSSALRATPIGGSVTLKASRKDPFMIIQTQDTALHLPQEALASMEYSYPVLENSPARGYEGWEVGLPLVRKYVDLHGGSMELERLPEKGTIFRISLPTYYKEKQQGEGNDN